MSEQMVRLGWWRRAREDSRQEFAAILYRLRYSRACRWWLRGFVWRVEGWLLAWTKNAEPCDDYWACLLAENEDGDWLVPAGTRNGEPWWQGYWHWWNPLHWPVYLRSRRRNTYVMVECIGADS